MNLLFFQNMPKDLLSRALATWLLLAGAVNGNTTLTLDELELQAGKSGSIPVLFHSDVAVPAVQMDVLFDPVAYTASPALPGTMPVGFKVDSFVVEPGRLRVVVGAASNAALIDGAIFNVPLTAVDEFSSFYPVVLTDFALSSPQGTSVAGKLAPRVRLLNLTGGTQVDGHAGVSLAVEVGATDGSVARVEYYVGGVKVGQSTAGPFTFVWTPPGSGPFVVQAIAFDSNGLQTGSRSIPIVVTHVGTTAVKGIYAGLIQDDPFALGSSGYAQFATTTKGTFTVKLMLGGRSFGQSGKFATDGTATVRFPRAKGQTPITMQLQQYATDLVDQIGGRVTDGTPKGDVIEDATFTAELSADRAIWKTGTREPSEKGRYTVVLPAADDAAETGAPLGTGAGILTVSKTGTIAATLRLADGTVASQGTFLSKDKHWPLFASLSGGKGVMIGQLNFSDEVGVSDFGGTAAWVRPSSPKAVPFKPGFDTDVDVVGSRYTVPPPNQRTLNLANVAGNADFLIEEGGLSTPLERLLTMSSTNRLSLLAPDSTKLALILTPSTGMLTGSFVNPSTGKVTSIVGALLQKQNVAAGYVLSGPLGGVFSLGPNQSFPVPDLLQPQGSKPLPGITIKAPKESGRVSSPDAVVLSGTAVSKKAITAVRYQTLFQGALSPVMDATGGANWTINFQPQPNAGGTYKFFVKTVDAGGNESDVVARSLFYVVPTPLTVVVNGPGTITAGYIGTTQREVGRLYTLTAKPAHGHRFVGWTGSVASASSTITFTMAEGFSIQANFQ